VGHVPPIRRSHIQACLARPRPYHYM